MTYRNLQECVAALDKQGMLLRVEDELSADLEVAEVHRRVFASGGPALLFTRPQQSRFPLLSNLFGTRERTHFIFRRTLDVVRDLVAMKLDPAAALRNPWKSGGRVLAALRMFPRFVGRGPILDKEIRIDQLPRQRSWPMDGGPFITLPQVYTEDPRRPGWQSSNLGMYRVQLAGNQYRANEQVGMHYQIHRGIGVQHAAAIAAGKPLRVNVFVGGAPAMTVAAVMPLPEGMSELAFAGVLAGSRIPLIARQLSLPLYAEADFCLSGYVQPNLLLPEGPFGDHLGYYSLQHDFPVMRVERVYHRRDAIWPFTVVGRPPQEDTMFGELVHEISGPVIPSLIPGVDAVHAVDAAGVHPLLLAIGSERYVPYLNDPPPMELLTQASAILGQGQLSLAKYLLIVSRNDAPTLRVDDIASFLTHLLERVDWGRDLHFQTHTTMDTLDYSGGAMHRGSKLVIAATGRPRRTLPRGIEDVAGKCVLPDGFTAPRCPLPGVLVVQGPPYSAGQSEHFGGLRAFCREGTLVPGLGAFPLIVLVDDAHFAARSLANFLWITFTRSDPAADIDGFAAEVVDKHWGCRDALVIDARQKPHHAPPLEVDSRTTAKIDALAARGGPLARWL